VNSLRLQSEFFSSTRLKLLTFWLRTGYVARAISDYLTSETGITIIFESAIVPKWKDSRLSFKNVYVSRRPSQSQFSRRPTAEEDLAGVHYDVHNHPAYHRVGDDDEPSTTSLQDEDTNYTMFDLNIDSVDVTLSLKRWLDGKGLIEDAVVRGVRGVVGTSCSSPVVRFGALTYNTTSQIDGVSSGIQNTL